MKKILYLFIILILGCFFGCEAKTTYTIEDFENAVEVIKWQGGTSYSAGNFYKDGVIIWDYYFEFFFVLTKTEYLLQVRYTINGFENVELYKHLGLEPSEEYFYIIATYMSDDIEDISKFNTKIRAATEKDLIRIYAEYLYQYAPPVSQITTTTSK